MYNNVTLVGRLGRDPEEKMTQGGTNISKFSLAVNRQKKDDPTDWFDCIAFAKTADFCNKYLGKGREVLVSGKIQIDTWTDKEGNKKSKPSVICDQVKAIGSREASEEQNPAPAFDQSHTTSYSEHLKKIANRAQESKERFMNKDVPPLDSIPF